ncbi:MAG: hypothetical protein H0T89_12960 [Deltaproteobacteria bacterium]|nr:hypothetical protein [Deltaproteobacteria bacterium]MDQ3300441.1 hypothetical protein [Myxococcota bacterium]
MTRDEVERAILDEEAMLEEIARLLEHQTPLAAWPEPARTALACALADDASSRAEGWKVTALRRHLFGAAGTIPAMDPRQAATDLDLRRADRLRSDLPARVRFRAAMFLGDLARG